MVYLESKLKFIIFIFVFILLFCFIGVFYVQGSNLIDEEKDILILQNDIDRKINVYGYTFDNPKVLVNPYLLNDYSALILFETDDYVSVNVNVNDEYSYDSLVTNRHYIGIYNLHEGNNYVILKYGDKVKNIEVNTINNGNNIDSNDSYVLSNNHLIIPTNDYLEDSSYTGFREVDALGKIYFEYIIDSGYKGISCEIDDEQIAILSNKLIVVDRQTGEITYRFDISDYEYDYYYMDYINNTIVLYSSDKVISVDMDGNIKEVNYEYNRQIFRGDINFSLVNGYRFYKEKETKVSDKNIWLINYKKKKDIDIVKQFNRIIVKLDKEDEQCNSYLILDKLLDKKVYELCDSDNYIYTKGLKGKYSVYIKTNGTVYKTDKYLVF